MQSVREDLKKIDKPVLVFSTPRSGSTVFLYTLFDLLREKKQCKDILGEFFSNGTKPVWKNNTLLVEHSKEIDFSREFPFEKKLSIIKNIDPKDYLMKVFPQHLCYRYFPNQLNRSARLYLTDHYHFLCLTRKNKIEQCWSRGWANHLYEWGNLSPTLLGDLSKSSVVYERVWFDNLVRDIRNFDSVVSELRDYNLYHYENLDFKSMNPHRKKNQYPMEKSELFSNRNEVLDWAEEEGLTTAQN